MKISLITSCLILFLSCNKKYNNYIVSAKNDTIEIKSVNWNNHENAPGKVVRNLYLELDNYTKVHDSANPNIQIKLGDSIYSAHGISFSFSREMPKSHFFYLYKNVTKELFIDTVEGKPMIFIAPVKGANYKLPPDLKTNELFD